MNLYMRILETRLRQMMEPGIFVGVNWESKCRSVARLSTGQSTRGSGQKPVSAVPAHVVPVSV